MKIITKNFFISLFLIFVFLASFYLFKKESFVSAQSCQSHNLSGYAWSSNIGWISFSCENENAPFDYGVDVDAAGVLSGYAWASNAGWLSFQSGDISNCPIGPCLSPRIDFSTGKISGWAKFLAGGTAESGGWEGWVRFNDYSGQGAKLVGSSLEGYAWGGDSTDLKEAVVGWISFKGSNYQVAYSPASLACAQTSASPSSGASPLSSTISAGFVSGGYTPYQYRFKCDTAEEWSGWQSDNSYECVYTGIRKTFSPQAAVKDSAGTEAVCPAATVTTTTKSPKYKEI